MDGADDVDRAKKKMVFVTVGTTCFDSLVRAVDTEEVRLELRRRGYTDLLIQMGRGSYVPAKFSGEDGSLSVDYFTFSSSIADYLKSASLVISHAGSGSIFETLRLGKPLIVVVNEDLMDNHQCELADELAERRHVFCCRPRTLRQTLQSMDLESLLPYPPGDAMPVARLINRSSNEETNQVRSISAAKDTDVMEIEDADQQCQGVSVSREEKVSSLKAGLVHIARKMPKNAHCHLMLGLMYQRLGQPQKCILQVSTGDSSDKDLEAEELDIILLKLKESMQLDSRHASAWSTLGLLLLRTGRLQSAISVLSSLLASAPDNLDALANLGIAYLQSGNLDLSARCFQDLILKDQNHPAALVNYAAVLLSKYGSVIAGAGASAGEGAFPDQIEAANVAKECLIAAAKADCKAGRIWLNLANAYYVAGDHKNARRCLEQAAKLEPNYMSTRYAVAVHRVKDVERSQDASEQLSWAASEMASILKEGDPAVIDLPIAWAGLAMVHRAQHEIAAAFETSERELAEAKERAQCTLKQAIEEDPDDAVQWHQLGLHSLCTLQFETSQKFLKAAVARCKECSYAWSNLGISLQLSEDPSSAEQVYKRALSLATTQQAHAILSNLGNLYRQLKRLELAKMILAKALELCPGYAPAQNNLGLVFVVEGRWAEAVNCFEKALQADPLLDAATSNMMKAMSMAKIGRR